MASPHEPAGGSSKRPTLKAVADAANVSIATASNVIAGGGRASGGKSRYSEETERRVREAARALNYTPNLAARAVRTGKSGLVQLSLSMLSDPWSLAMVHAMNEATNSHGLIATILADGDWVKMLQLQQADVAFIDGVAKAQEEDVRRLAKSGHRLVVMSNSLSPDGFDVISQPVIPGCRMMVDYLSQNYETIGCIATSRPVAPEQSRLVPYIEMLEESGRPLRPEWLGFYESDIDSAYAQATIMLTQPERPRAIYATTDFAAQAAIRAATRLGLRVPQDVAISGVGNAPDGGRSDPGLTTVGPTDFFETVSDLVVERALADSPPGELHEFPWSLQLRESA